MGTVLALFSPEAFFGEGSVLARLGADEEGALRLGATTRLRPSEIATGERLSTQLGQTLYESPHEGAEFVDAAGKSYDALGTPEASANWSKTESDFYRSIDKHLAKSNDFTAIDLTGFTDPQKAAVSNYVNSLPGTSQAKIIRIGF